MTTLENQSNDLAVTSVTTSATAFAPSATTSAAPSAAKRRGAPRALPVDAEHEAWLAKYTPVEQAIIEAQEKRLIAKFRRKYDMARRFGEICELTDGAAVRWRSDGFFEGEEARLAAIGSLGYWEYMDYIGKSATRRITRMRTSLTRPLYYEAENRRRRALAAERRKIRERRTVNACPTKEAILEAWKDRKTSHEAAIWFGSLLEDLECYVDNSLKFDEEGAIIGRQGGIKLWLKENIPALALVYSSVMRYKAAAKKLRQIAGIADPTPAAAMVEAKCDYDAENQPEPAVEIVRARAIWGEVEKTAGKSVTALFERLDDLTDPARIEDANMLEGWRRKYENEITVRNKGSWWKRLQKLQTA